MEIIFTFISIFCILVTIGAIFGLPIYLPAIKNTARLTAFHRQLTLAITGTLTFLICISGIAYLDALVTNSFSESISGIEKPFITNSHQDNLLMLEMWLQNVVPPSIRADCYTSDVAVCTVAQSIEASLHMNTKFEYLLLVVHGLIATTSNFMMVSHILQDNRKKKAPVLVTG